jgi:hypothetical protein
MVKKRLGRSSWKNKGHTKKLRFLGMPPNKSAQITVFIILGLLLLFIFMMTIKLATDAKLSGLEAEKEKVISKSFKKEALRIYVEDCLNDALEDGLVLIGKQGRLWQGQPGGTKPFVEEITGVTYQPGERIFYGISNENYPQHQNAYPCNNDSYSPEFCQYQYPNTSIGFGSWEIKTSTIEGDLRQYLINRTIFCVKNFTESEISDKTKIEDANINLKLDITNDGINVNVEYPLTLSLGKEEFFHISKFDFFYPTKFNVLLDAAVARPIYYDWKFIDFDYTKDVLEQKSFNYASNSASCVPEGDLFVCSRTLLYDKYKSLAIDMEELSLPNGDTILSFKSPEIINLPEPYEFRFAIQNRPPALDYVNHLSCILKDNPETEDNEADNSYDYLVIPGDIDYGKIDITLNALDADGDVVTYAFDGLPDEFGDPAVDEPEHLIVTDDLISLLPSNFYTFTAKASDGHLEDWQEIRILVDTPLEADMDVWYPYQIEDDNGDLVPYLEYFKDSGDSGVKFISVEDQLFINITYPESSLIEEEGSNLKLEYVHETSPSFATLTPPTTKTEKTCYDYLPATTDNNLCDPESYFSQYDDYLEFWPNLKLFGDVGSFGKFKFSWSRDYCFDSEEDTDNVDVKVVKCIPHVNPSHPYASPNHETTFALTADGKTDFTDLLDDKLISPFLATHSCCNSNWEPYTADEKHVCYVSPAVELGCFPVEEGELGGSILSQGVNVNYCSGDRGNVCDGIDDFIVKSLDKPICGDPDPTEDYGYSGECNKVAPTCGSLEPNHLEEGPGGFWCHGDEGCGKHDGNDYVACTSEIVSRSNKLEDDLSNFDEIVNTFSAGGDLIVCGCSDELLVHGADCWDLTTGVKGKCDMDYENDIYKCDPNNP